MTHTFDVRGSSARSAFTNRPGSATRKPGYKQLGSTSFVDETLFGSPDKCKSDTVDFEPPWGEKPRPKPLLFYTPPRDKIGDTSARSGANTPHRQTPRKHHIVTHKPSFVDETLFGPKLKEADFPAPWETKDSARKSRPLIFSPTNYLQKTDNLSARSTSRSYRPGSSQSTKYSYPNSAKTRPPSATLNRPAWK